jgi:two-component system sensor histidine kinase KdpD
MVEAEAFLRTPPSADDFATRRQAVLASNAVLLQVSNDAVAMLTRYSEGQVRAVIRWELIVVALVVALASTRTWRLLQVETALRQSQAATMQALQQSDAVKSSLLSSVSHELRTPLTAIKAMLFNLQESSPAQQDGHKDCLKDIDEEVDYLNRLVGNLLDMSRLEAGVLAPNREWNLVEELAEAAIRRLGRRLECRPLQINLPATLPPVYVDGLAIQQVLVNLLDNAVKFSPRDTPISLEARLTGAEVEVSVRNEGPGIPMHELERIFDRFYRLTAPTSAIQGTGLGLAICKGIIEAHGGRIEARSIQGKETSICFHLPLVKDLPGNRLHTMQRKAG